MKLSKRHHWIAQCYQKNFAEPMFGEVIQVYEFKRSSWDDTRRTPNGIGWSPFLNVFVNEDGTRTDEVEKLFTKLDNDVAPAFRKAAEYRHRDMTDRECAVLALFIAASVARLPEMIDVVTASYYDSRPPEEKQRIDGEVERLLSRGDSRRSEQVRSEVLKRDYFSMAWDLWIPNFMTRLLDWHWFWIQTDRSNPFVTSDEPVFRQRHIETDTFLVSFPVSTEVAVLICNKGELVRRDHDHIVRVKSINKQTIERADEFVICHKTDFPGDEFLTRTEDKPQAG